MLKGKRSFQHDFLGLVQQGARSFVLPSFFHFHEKIFKNIVINIVIYLAVQGHVFGMWEL